jgi:hypothetical protein
VLLGNRQSARLAGFVEARMPRPAENGLIDPEKGGSGVGTVSLERSGAGAEDQGLGEPLRHDASMLADKDHATEATSARLSRLSPDS